MHLSLVIYKPEHGIKKGACVETGGVQYLTQIQNRIYITDAPALKFTSISTRLEVAVVELPVGLVHVNEHVQQNSEVGTLIEWTERGRPSRFFRLKVLGHIQEAHDKSHS